MMNASPQLLKRSWMLLALMASAAGVSQAAISACTASEPTEVALTGYNGAANGCASVDMSYQNFTVSGGAASGTWVSPTLANTAAYATNGSATSNTATTTLNLDPFQSAGGSWTGSSSNNTSLALSSFSWVATAQTGGTYGSGTPYTLPGTSGYTWVMDAIRLLPNVSIDNSNAANNATITLTICLNATTTASCGANFQGVITASFSGTSAVAYTASCTNVNILCSASGSNLLDISGSYTSVALTATIQAARGAGSNAGTVAINNLSVQFDTVAVAPEPSTFGLLGFALVGLGAYARRRNK